MKKVISTGYILANIIEDEYEGNAYKALELMLDNDETVERVKLKANASYKVLKDTFAQQAKNNK